MAEETQINVGMNVDGVATGVNKAKTELRSLQAEVDKVAALSKKGGDALGKLPEGVDAAKAAKALTSISNGIKRVSEEAVLGRNSVELFTAKFEKAGISKDVYKPIIDAYGQVRTQVDLANGAFTQSGKVLNEYGMGAKATAAALRQVPAQLTDIVVSLQGGQAPLTVFLQQGGQLRDVFGSASGALRAMAGTLVKLINPFTIAAGVVATLGLAYKQATDEVDVYRKALVLSGNDMGLSIGGLQRMAESISSTSGTVGAAAEALGLMAASSNVAAGGLEKATLSAIRFEKYAGVAIKDSVKAFADLANEPVQASERLNKQYNYLTASIYSQIKALEEQGDKAGAVALAQDQLANAQNRMSADLEAGLGRIEQAWNLAGKAASSAWDKFVGLGRPDPIEKVIAELETRLSFGKGMYGFGQDKAKIQEELDYWRHIKASQDDYAANQKRIAEQTSSQISLDKAWEAGLGKAERAQRAIAKLSGEFAKADQTPENQAKYAAAIQNILKGAEEKVKVDKAGNRELEKQAELLLTLSGYSKDYTEDVKRLVVMRQKGTLNEEAYLRAVNELVAKQPGYIAAEKERAAAIKEAGKAYEDSAKASIKYYEGMAKDNASLEKSNEKLKEEVEAIGMSASAKERLNEARSQAAIVIAQEQLALMNLQNSSEMEIQQAERQIELLKEQASLRRQGVVRTEADELAKANKKAAEESSKYWEDALMRAFESGKGFFESLWSTIKNTLKTQVLKVLVTGSMTGVSALASAATGGASDSVLGYVNGASNLNTLYGAGSQLLFGGAAGASTASLVGANAVGALGGDALGSLIALNGGWAGVATGTTAAGAAGTEALAGMSATGYGVIVAAAIAAIMYITSRGETRMGATYATGADGKAIKSEGPSGGEIAGDLSRSIFDSTQSSINATLKAVGSTAVITGFTAGLESSENGKGFAFAGGMVNGVGVGEYKGRNGGQFAMSDMTPQQAMEAYVSQMNQVTLEALQAATDVPALIANELKGIDIGKLTAAEVGELTKTVQTVIASVNVFNDSLKTLPFESLWDLSFKAAAGLVDAAGGFEKLNESLSGFYENFYSDAEQTANLTRVLGDTFESLGLSMPVEQLREWYRGQVEAAMALDQSVPANQAYLAGLLSIQSGVNNLADSAETAAQRIIDAASKLMDDIYSAQDDAFAEYLAAQSEYNDMISADQQAAAEAMSNAAEALKDALASAGQGIVQFIQSLLNTPTNAASNYRNDLALARSGDVEASKRLPTSGRAYLDTQINSSATAVDAARATAKMVQELNALPAVKSYEQQLLEAVQGTTAAVTSTTDAIKDMNAKIKAELTLDARSEILKIINLTVLDDTLTDDQKTLALAESAQIDKLIKLSSNNLFSAVDQQLALATTGTVAKTFTAALGAHDFDAMAIAYAQSSTIEKVIRASGGVLTLDQQMLLNGIEQYNKNIQIGVKIDSSELTEFQNTLMAIFGTLDITGLAASGVDLSSVISQEALSRLQSVSAYVNSFEWANTDLATRASQMHAVRTTAIAYGVSSEDVATALGITKNTLADWYSYLNVPFFAKGANFIPENTLAMVHEGERIIPAADNRELMSRLQDPQQNSEALVAEVRALRDDNAAQARAMVQLQQRLTKLMERWNSDGMPSTRIEV